MLHGRIADLKGSMHGDIWRATQPAADSTYLMQLRLAAELNMLALEAETRKKDAGIVLYLSWSVAPANQDVLFE